MSHSAYFHDPDGYRIELVYKLSRAEWEHDIDAAIVNPLRGSSPDLP
jgi:catechol 2,3-dioxygenase